MKPRCEIDGKYQHTEISAELAVAHILKTKNKKLRTYLCPYCGYYHLTKIKKFH